MISKRSVESSCVEYLILHDLAENRENVFAEEDKFVDDDEDDTTCGDGEHADNDGEHLSFYSVCILLIVVFANFVRNFFAWVSFYHKIKIDEIIFRRIRYIIY